MLRSLCRTVLSLLAWCMSLLAVCSCSLIYDYDNCPDEFSVASDWREAPTAEPEGMAYIFFADDTRDFWRYDFPGSYGGVVPLPDGCYHAIGFNDDTSATIISEPSDGFRGMKASTYRSRLYDSVGGGPDSLGTEPVVACPDQLWMQAIDEVTLTDDGVRWRADGSASMEYCPNKILTLFPRAMMASYTYEITDIKNLSGVRRMCAAMTGMASELSLCDGVRCLPAATLPVKAARQSDTSVAGSFLTIGLPAENAVENNLVLYVWLTDGRKFSYAFDVTDQTRNAPDAMNVHIKVGGIDLPESSPAGEGAFDVSVDGWVETIINIKG